MPRRKTPRGPKRRPTDPVAPREAPYREAYRRERDGTWPSWRERRAFWNRPDVPPELRNAAEPDPRPILADPGAAPRLSAARERFHERRARWLAGAAGAEG